MIRLRKTQDSSFTIEKPGKSFKKLEPVNVWHLCLIKKKNINESILQSNREGRLRQVITVEDGMLLQRNKPVTQAFNFYSVNTKVQKFFKPCECFFFFLLKPSDWDSLLDSDHYCLLLRSRPPTPAHIFTFYWKPEILLGKVRWILLTRSAG